MVSVAVRLNQLSVKFKISEDPGDVPIAYQYLEIAELLSDEAVQLAESVVKEEVVLISAPVPSFMLLPPDGGVQSTFIF